MPVVRWLAREPTRHAAIRPSQCGDIRLSRVFGFQCEALHRAPEIIFGGNISEYEKVSERAWFEAFQRVITRAKKQRADAIIGVRYDATELIQRSTEVLAYGTAVKLLKVH